ncbi:hypothetical protein CTH30272_00947 [Allocatenococcus thiocycli]|nr:hypothetical protein CTH30272_00947 [Catenococcus thiocycli]
MHINLNTFSFKRYIIKISHRDLKTVSSKKASNCQRQFKIDPLIDVIAEVKLTHPYN